MELPEERRYRLVFSHSSPDSIRGSFEVVARAPQAETAAGLPVERKPPSADGIISGGVPGRRADAKNERGEPAGGEGEWTLIFSTWGVKEDGRETDPDALWGAYGYTPERDVIRTMMTVDAIGASTHQLTIGFADMSQQGGLFMVWWDDQLATTPFTVAH